MRSEVLPEKERFKIPLLYKVHKRQQGNKDELRIWFTEGSFFHL